MVRKKRKHEGSSLWAVLLLLVLVATAIFLGARMFTVRHVEIAGNNQIEDTAVLSLVEIEPNINIFMVDKQAIKNGVETSPYLVFEALKRKLPSTLEIQVRERVAVAAVEYLGTYMHIDAEGIILKAAQSDGGLAQMIGMKVVGFTVGKPLVVSDEYQIKVATAVLEALVEANVQNQITHIDVSDTEDVRLISRQGISVRLGTAEDLALKLKRMQQIIPMLIAEGVDSGLLDVTLESPSYSPVSVEEEQPLENPAENPDENPEEETPPNPDEQNPEDNPADNADTEG